MKNLCQHRAKRLNLIGRQISRLRSQRSWSQETLSDMLQLAGWRISRSGVSKIERGLIYVHDFQLFYLAHVLGVQVPALFPKIDFRPDIHETLLQFIHNEKKRSMIPEPEAGSDTFHLITHPRSQYGK
jgi:transcriptional regulator with XRE-family HTH domain